VIPVAAVVVALLLVLVIVVVVLLRRKGSGNDDWEIEYDELEVGEQLGAGGYGEVHKATWKGTEVAVKVMASDRITKEMEKSFKDEAHTSNPLIYHIYLIKVYSLMFVDEPGAGDDVVAAPQRGAVHGGVDQGAQDVHRHGVYGPRLSLRRAYLWPLPHCTTQV
jgi:hypothetical protein